MSELRDGVKRINENVIKDGRSLVINTRSINMNYIPIGSLFIDGITSEVYVKKSEKNGFEKFEPSDIFKDRSITSKFIATNAVSEDHIGSGIITNKHIADNALLGTKILDGSIDPLKLDSITQEKLSRIPNDIAIENEITCNFRGDAGYTFTPGAVVELTTTGKIKPVDLSTTNPIIGVVSKFYKSENIVIPVVISGIAYISFPGVIIAGNVLSLGHKNGFACYATALETKASTSEKLVKCLLKL